MSKKIVALTRFAVAAGAASMLTVGVAGPAMAVESYISRNDCIWYTTSEPSWASTKASSANDCAGHGWVRVMYNGTTSYTAWKHSADTFNGAYYTPPAGKRIIKSQHKTCSDCSVQSLDAS
jgi:hypothetical protein